MNRLLLGSLLALASCTKETPPPPAPKPAEPARPAAEVKPAPLESETYALAIAPDGAWKAGVEGRAKVTVTAKPPLHVNPEYPVAFKPDGAEAVKFAGDRVPLAAAARTPCPDKAEDTCAAEFLLAVTPGQAGAAKVAGVLSFSVCSADRCLIEKVPMTLAVTVEP
jgi:hypothetical protein